MLLSGAAGIGKEHLANAFAKSLLCERSATNGMPCGSCEACHWFELDTHPDLRRLRPSALETAASDDKPEKRGSFEITIDQVRALEEFLQVGGHRQGRRIVIVNPAEAMNRSTANALLKSLEEPGEGVHFILISSRADELLPTIRSRCQRIPVPSLNVDTARSCLADLGIGKVELLALSGGAPFAAMRFASPDFDSLLETCLLALRSGPKLDPVSASQQIEAALPKAGKGGELRQLVDWLQRWVHDLACQFAGAQPRFFPGETKSLAQLASVTSAVHVSKYNRLLVQYKKLSEHTLNTRLFLHELVMDYRAIFIDRGPHVR